MRIISDQQEFKSFCEEISVEKVIFMDTEFYRRKTYYAKLSLVQVATHSTKVIIDAINLSDLAPLKELLLAKNICKVFHAPDQDFDIFLHLFGKLPENIFDTQTAAGVIGLDEVMGYGRLCKQLLNVTIDKTMQNAEWLERPLTDELLEYAIKDVEYLPSLYRELSQTIERRRLWDTYNARAKKLLDPEFYKPKIDKILKKMSYNTKLTTNSYLAYFLQLREECAQSLDIPRSYCASDQEIVKLSQYLPTNDAELSKLNMENTPLTKGNFKKRLLDLSAGIKEMLSNQE